MTPIQQLMLGVGAKKKTYLDDVFSTYLYDGNSTTLSVNSGVDNTKGGMIWFKDRSGTESHLLFDTERGTSNYIQSNSTAAQTTGGAALTSFDNDGYTLGASAYQNNSGRTYTSWNFRKAPGFFDVVTYSGNGSARTISHSLGSVPGFIMVKQTSSAANWTIYHRDNGNNKAMYFTTGGSYTDGAFWNNTTPTASVFSLGNSDNTNKNGETYVAYLFAGGESTAATARSLKFDNDVDALEIASSSDFGTGTGNFTWEAWIKPADNPTYNPYWLVSANGSGTDGGLSIQKEGGNVKVKAGGGTTYLSFSAPEVSVWTHFAVCRSGSTIKAFYNGIEQKSNTCTENFDTGAAYIGFTGSNINQSFNGLMSNVRWIKGSALYTSSFNPPTETLTNVTNTKLLCCNNSSITGSTVTPTTISQRSGSNITATTDSPFDDPAGFVFGDAEDQNVIKCGSYKGNGSTDGPEIDLGWEPQWVMIKATGNISEHWTMFDSMGGIVTGGYDMRLLASTNAAENTGNDFLELTATGYKIKKSSGIINGNLDEYIYMCIRRPDGYVGKPADAGTGVFAMDVGNSSSTIPTYDSGFPVDFALQRKPATTFGWDAVSRLTGTKYLQTNDDGAEADYTQYTFDSNTGWAKDSGCDATFQSWMWKRHAGSFDVVAFQGTTANPGPSYRHSLGKVPELKILKRRNANTDWFVTGTALSQAVGGNNNAKDYYLKLNSSDAATTHSNYWEGGNDTSTDFTVRHGNSWVGGSDDPFLCLLFASVSGISSVGSYTGNGNGSSGITVTTGFQLRFLIIKRADGTGPWYVVDSLRGMSNSGDEKILKLNSSDAQVSDNIGNTSSTGFTITSTHDTLNGNGDKYIYYAHA